MALFDHARDDCLGADEGSHKVDVHDLAEIFRAHLGHGDALDDAGVVHKDVDGAEFRGDFRHQLLHLGLVRHVRDVAVGLDALCLIIRHCLVQVLLAAAVENDLRAGARQGFRDGESDAVGSAGHKGYFSLQGKTVHDIHLLSPFVISDPA